MMHKSAIANKTYLMFWGSTELTELC